jgi:hypothetical protein
VTFAPNLVGTINGAIRSGSPAVVSLSGTGLAPVGFSPAALDFGTVAIGAASTAQPVTLTNNQGAALAISGIVTSGDYAQANNCPASLAAGASCAINITFQPTAKGSIPGALTVSTDASPAAQPVGLNGIGSGSATSQVAFSPSSLSFGNQEAGTSSASQTVTLTNTSSSSSLTIQSVAVSGGYSATHTCTAPIAPNGTCTITATFQPAAGLVTIPYPGAITVADSGSTSPQVVGLSGTGVAPVSAFPAAVDFGVVNQNAASDPQTVTLTNFDSASENVSATVPGPYKVASNSCTTSLANGAQCSVDVTLGPSSAGTRNFAMTYTFSSGGFLNPQIVNLSGCLTPVIRTPTSLNFGAVPVGQTSATETVTLSGGAFNFSGFTVSGSNAADFAIANNTCSSPLSGSCAVDLTFKPAAGGTKTATLQIADDQLCSPQPISLVGGSSAGPFVVTSIVGGTGSGTITSNPAGLSCGSQGSACSASFTTGTTVTLTATPDANSHFVGWGGACSGKASCTLTMTADRQVTAAFDVNPSLTVGVGTNLSGSGKVTSSPAGIDCPASSCQAFFAPGTAVTLTATPGTGSTFTGWSNGSCSGTGTCQITMNADQHVDATFNGPPTLVVNLGGTGTGTVTSTPAGINCPAACQATFPQGTVVTLSNTVSGNSTFGGWGGACSGTGACSVSMSTDQNVSVTFTGPPDFAVDIAPVTSATVVPGGSASFNVSVSGLNGFTGSVSLSCSSPAAQGVNCSLSSSSVPAGSSATLFISTRAPSAALAPLPGIPRRSPIYAAWIPLLGLFLIGAGSTRRRSSRRKLALLLPGLLLLGLIILQAACGGGGGSPRNPGTLAGTYTVTLSESSGTIQHTSTVNITVQ